MTRWTTNPIDVRCHGTYVWDLGHERVKSLGKITKEHAAELLHIPADLREHEYMWLNKGWLVVGRPLFVIDRNAKWERGQDAPMIQVGDGDPFTGERSLVAGDRLVYLADGTYYLIEVVS